MQKQIYSLMRSGILCLLLCLGLTACSAIQSTATPEGTVPLTQVNVCYTTHNPTQAVPFYALQEGIFAQYGLDVNLILINGGSKAVAALIAGEVDFCQTSGAPIVNAVVAGADVVFVAGLFNTHLYSLMVRPEIKEAADLKGQTIAIGNAGGSTDAMTRLALRYLHLIPDQDVAIVSMGEQSERLLLMERGQAVGTLVSVPETIRAQEFGYHVLLDMSTLNLPQMRSGIATTRTYLHDEPSTATAFMQAIVTAIARMKQDETGAKAALADFLQLDPTTDATLIEESYQVIIQKYLAELPYPTAAGIQEDLNALALENPAATSFSPADIVDTSILEQLEETGFIRQLYAQQVTKVK